jgi:hypothetical protein
LQILFQDSENRGREGRRDATASVLASHIPEPGVSRDQLCFRIMLSREPVVPAVDPGL